MKKAKFHFEVAAMAGDEEAGCNLGFMEYKSGNVERDLKHWMIAVSAGYYEAMYHLQIEFEQCFISRAQIDSTLIAYNNSCAKMRSEARDACVCAIIETNENVT